MIIKKCNKCGALIYIMDDCNCEGCGITCCGEKMEVQKENSVDASFEKHVPTYEINDGLVTIKVNHVMEDEHYIEWIGVEYENHTEIITFKPGEEAKAVVPYKENMKLYSYCNIHGLWSNTIK